MQYTTDRITFITSEIVVQNIFIAQYIYCVTLIYICYKATWDIEKNYLYNSSFKNRLNTVFTFNTEKENP